MARIKLILNENHLKLIRQFRVERFDDIKVGFDSINPYGGQYLMEDLALILGYWDKAVEGTEKDYDGRKFGIENEVEMLNVHNYVVDNIDFILSLIIQYATDGGIKPGTYTALDTQLDWKFKD